jgi:dihydrofolate reductase
VYRGIRSSPVSPISFPWLCATPLPRPFIRPWEQSRRRDEEVAVRKVITSEFVSLDGVVEDPGGAEGSEYGGWSFAYFNEELGQLIGKGFTASDAMLMGRTTYEQWAAFWPNQDPEENPDAVQMNSVRKYVVSTTLQEPLEWHNSTLIAGGVAEEIAQLKRQPDKDIVISCSISLVRSLPKDGLIDELRFLVHPVVVGGGKRIFEEEGERIALELVDSKTFSTGVVYLAYSGAHRS